MVEIMALPLGRAMSRGCRPEPEVLRCKHQRSRQGFPVALMRTSELDMDLVDGVFLVVMRCLGSWAPVSKHRRQQ
jgi:hypothetical protein